MIMSLLLRHGTPFPVGRVIAMLWEETYLFSHSERLEARTLLSATLEKHTLLVKGTPGDDVITLTLESTDGNAYKPSVRVRVNETVTHFSSYVGYIYRVNVRALAGNDTIRIGSLFFVTVDGAEGDD